MSDDASDPGPGAPARQDELTDLRRRHAELEAAHRALARELEEVHRGIELQHRIAVTLQHSLLPQSIPEVPGLEIAARYRASTEQIEVGGDFYEVLPLEPGRVAVAIGDVQGHSLQAATVMAELRNALRAYLLEGHGPAAVLDRLNQLLLRFHPELTATVACAVIEDGRRLVLANAGHLPPVLCDDHGCRFLEVAGPLLGLPGSRAEETVELHPGAVLVFVTDGLVERRGGGLDDGLEALRLAVERSEDDLEGLCDRLIAEVGPGDTAVDDIAVLGVRVAS
jgi:serine phosphatase RsbU (regulator of sigma subunit)